MGTSTEPEYLKDVLDTYHISGVRYNKSNADIVYEQNKVLQGHSKYPVLIAANTEAGGDGAANDGTYIGHEVKIAATNDSKYAYEMGRIAGGELVDSFTGFEDTRYSSADKNANRINPAKTKQ